MLAGLIEWHGVFGFVVTFWDQSVSAPFGKVLAAMFAWVNLPRPPEILVDYLTLGILFFAGSMRSRSLMVSAEYRRARRFRGNPVAGILLRAIQITCVIALWPVIASLFLLQVLSHAWRRRFGVPQIDFEGHDRARVSLVALAPFAAFLILWLLNSALGAWLGPTA